MIEKAFGNLFANACWGNKACKKRREIENAQEASDAQLKTTLAEKMLGPSSEGGMGTGQIITIAVVLLVVLAVFMFALKKFVLTPK